MTEGFYNNLFSDNSRVRQQMVSPTAVKTGLLASNLVQNTLAASNGPFSIVNNTALTVQSLITARANKNISIAGTPYCIIFFQTSIANANIIGVNVLNTGYIFQGTFCMPNVVANFTVGSNSPTVYGASNSKNLIYVTTLINTTGSTQTIYYVTNTRYIIGAGGG